MLGTVGLKNEIKFRKKKSAAINFDPKSNGDTEKLFGKAERVVFARVGGYFVNNFFEVIFFATWVHFLKTTYFFLQKRYSCCTSPRAIVFEKIEGKGFAMTGC